MSRIIASSARVDSASRFVISTGRRLPYEVDITEHCVPLRGLPEKPAQITAVHITDIHAGYANLGEVYEETVARVNALSPDYVLLTGDYIDDNTKSEYLLTDLLKQFRPKHGIYATYGNHDHRRGIEEITRLLEAADVRILNNASVCTEQGLWIVGVDDYFEGKPDIQRAFAGVPLDATAILLSHNPSILDRVTDRDVLQLSGHTHGGQIALPFPTPKMVIKLHLRCDYVAGWYNKGKAKLYLNRGLGVTGKPFRYRCPAEIAIFRFIAST